MKISTVCGLMAIAMLSAAVPAAHSQQMVVDGHVTSDSARIMSRLVTLRLDAVGLITAINAVARNAGVHVQYPMALVEKYTQPVTLHATRLPLKEALSRVLDGTRLHAIVLEDDLISVKADADGWETRAGIVTGRVVDAGTRRPIPGATITLDNKKIDTRTDEHGAFRIMDVLAGEHHIVVRRLGYQVYTASVVVKDDDLTTLTIALATTVTRLSEVVMTAIGDQRRVEVGNVIAHLNVDSIAATAPVASVTDILAGRVPGLQVSQASGLIGNGASLRIRGNSSVVLQSNPIIIVDGVRQDNAIGGIATPFNSTFIAPTPNRLDQLDISQIETIDVLKGPAASTEYGTDAANGVIVIRTKRGNVGRPQWHGSTERGWSEIPVNFPEYYYGWGHLTDATQAPVNCTLVPWLAGQPSVTTGTCVVDSVTHANPLNHVQTSLYGSGLRERYDLGVSGGSELIRYYVSGGTSHDVGTTKLPDVFRTQALNLGFPSSVLNPNSQRQNSGRANLTVHINSASEMQVNGEYATTHLNAPSTGQINLGPQYSAAVLDSAHNYGYGTITGLNPLVNLGTLQVTDNTTATAGLNADWRPSAWFSGHVNAGVSHESGESVGSELPQANNFLYGPSYQGSLSVANYTTDVTSADTRASLTLPLSNQLRSTLSAGVQLARTQSRSTSAYSIGDISAANFSLNGAQDVRVSQSDNASATLGGYLEEQVGVVERLFITGAIRLDGASGFGDDHHVTAYPKLSMSWLALNTGSNTIRVRAAYGAAGQQPANGASFQLYTLNSVAVDGSAVTGAALSSPGNPNLRPERSRELEGGVDLGLWDDRVTFEVTSYTKRTTDALINSTLGFEFGGAPYQENIGSVRNTGTEITVQGAIVRSPSLNWNVTINASVNHNKLLHLASGVTTLQNSIVDAQRNVVGYPLNGYWGTRATYRDADGNGLITPDEVTVADSSTYLGSSVPTHETSLASQLSVFHGALTFGTLIDVQGGGLIDNQLSRLAAFGSLRAQHDSTASLLEQATPIALYYEPRIGTQTSLDLQAGWFVRWRELSTTYNVPTSFTRATRLHALSITAAVRNLGLWTHYRGIDPETSDRFRDNDAYNPNVRADNGGSVPLSRTWLIRLNAGL